ncbi:MAG: transcriptional repressor [Tannerella sp.]|jgi:Fur family ferric uptake transcriptional regulator|nr:transcriptional repressor [Tannerella sp.]
MNDIFTKMLEERGIKPTSVRILILRAMLGFDRAFSMNDLVNDLISVDKSTISRTLHLFHNSKLIHSFADGSGSMKYSVCSNDCDCSLDDLHAHFYCNYCKQAFCIENIPVPKFELLQNAEIESINLVIKGYCGKCNKFAT